MKTSKLLRSARHLYIISHTASGADAARPSTPLPILIMAEPIKKSATKATDKIVVDLAGLNLTPAQIDSIGAAVRSAALREIGGLSGDEPRPLGLIPHGPGWIG